jgi:hypothetical protein
MIRSRSEFGDSQGRGKDGDGALSAGEEDSLVKVAMGALV